MIKVVFWSQTGNTEAMADAVVEGIQAAGGEGKAISVSDISAADLAGESVFALGCPAMGDEVLDGTFRRRVASVRFGKEDCSFRIL